MNQPIISHTAYDGTITFKNAFSGKVVGYAGWAGFIAYISRDQGWKAYGSPTQEAGYFLAVPPSLNPEDLPINPGNEPWGRMSVEELLDFVDDDQMAM